MAESVLTAPRALQLDAADNVAVAVRDLEVGDQVAVGEMTITLSSRIAYGHKIALEAIAAGQPIRKYAEVIGVASTDIARGEHVHVHNVISSRLPGPGREASSWPRC